MGGRLDCDQSDTWEIEDISEKEIEHINLVCSGGRQQCEVQLMGM